MPLLLESFRITFGIPDAPCDLAAVEQGLADHCGREHIASYATRGIERFDTIHLGDPVVLSMFDEPKDEKGRVWGRCD